MSRIRYIKGYFTPDLGLGKGANYTEIEDGWTTRQIDSFEDYDRWLCSGCPDDYSEELELAGGVLCDQPLIIDEYEIQALGDAFFEQKYGLKWRDRLDEMFVGMVGMIEIRKEEFEKIWTEAIRRCLEQYLDIDLKKKPEIKYEQLQ